MSFQGDVRFPDVGVHLGVIEPGEPTCMYHSEDNQEGFLVLSGRCLAIVERAERMLEEWDYLHCPRGTRHVLVGAGTAPCLVLGLGARREDAGPGVFHVDEVARRHGAGVGRETSSSTEAYAGVPPPVDGPAPPLS